MLSIDYLYYIFLFFFFFFFFKQKTAYEIRLSLVGSEMCIRDSKDTDSFCTSQKSWTTFSNMTLSDLKTAFEEPLPGIKGHQLLMPSYRNLLNLDCLLYTSDAADEEDSVDLGGRRIIKKKKKKNKKICTIIKKTRLYNSYSTLIYDR